jgi:uncharacterized alpha-E superfamily protein
VDLTPTERWWPIVVVTGEQDRIEQHLTPEQLADDEQVQEYLTWSEDNPASIVSSVHWARENARTIREVISLEMWQTLNAFWHWLGNGQGRRLYRRDPEAFYRHVREQSALFQGTAQQTMLHDAAFDFMRLGMLLERAGWTARILDVKHHLAGAHHDESVDSPLEAAHAIALLRSCSATDPFFRQEHAAPTGQRVVAFLLKADRFPRSVQHCLDRAWRFMRRVKPDGGVTGTESAALLGALLGEVQSRTPEQFFELGLHDQLTQIIDRTAGVCEAIHRDYFAPEARL